MNEFEAGDVLEINKRYNKYLIPGMTFVLNDNMFSQNGKFIWFNGHACPHSYFRKIGEISQIYKAIARKTFEEVF